ncbi:nucleoside 2-deoxyribosyltransferase [uncultured Candidatus Kuenenia sp.]|jgi:nucleoside 2-deoxyribosyltransferase|uniref:nucleoside 2-deoxyribosyltransferase n=1 Tax=uncultured Candidatus Kuenenia sp. TaxID=1048336 RepID=UPI00031F32D2|nr:nucleoside 2-deoxyribosyltransferase [uncultured Candidatus Kuenenia sp.]
MKMVFISGKLSGIAHEKFNKEMAKAIRAEGYDVYLPQEQLPRKVHKNCLEILKNNEKAIGNSDIVLVIFDNMDMGVAMESEYAYVRGKLIIGYRSTFEKNLGSMVEGCVLVHRELEFSNLK